MAHYFSQEQAGPLKLKKISAFLRGHDFEFYTGSGVFSPKKIDSGTQLLVENAIIDKNWKILDLGCGYGAVGIAMAKLFQEASITMADINTRAVQLAKMNLKLNHVTNAEVLSSDLYKSIEGKFNTILVNPPQKAGKEICFEIIEKSKNHLEPNGLLQLVARHNIGGKELEKKMDLVFGNVRAIAKKGGYRIYVSKLL